MNVIYFVSGVLIIDWMKDVMSSEHLTQFLSTLITVIKYNSTYLGEDTLSSLVS